VSITSVYNKINGIETDISAGLVRHTVDQTLPIVEQLRGSGLGPLPGKRIKLLDGNCIEKTEHRIQELRDIAAGPLPGKSLVVYDSQLRMPIDVFPCEDGHAQERSLLKDVLPTVEPKDVWIADRNFCTVDFTCQIACQGAFFIIREHKNYPWQEAGKEKYIGKTETGKVYEQPIIVCDYEGNQHNFRRVRVCLDEPTRDGDTNIYLITNLSKRSAHGKKIAQLYRGRWTIETAFQHLAEYLNSEINTLGYPKAALFGFCVALVSYIILCVIKAALASVHGADVVESQLSLYYVADEISGNYRGMMTAIGTRAWVVFRFMSLTDLVKLLRQLAANLDLSAYLKNPRGPKKPQPKRQSCKNKPHVSTARLLAERSK